MFDGTVNHLFSFFFQSLTFTHSQADEQQADEQQADEQADERALLDAARSGNVEQVLLLLDKGVNKNYQDEVRAPSDLLLPSGFNSYFWL